MITKDTYGKFVVGLSFAFLLFLLICSFVVSFRKIDLLYIITLIVFAIKYIRLEKWFDDRYSLPYF